MYDLILEYMGQRSVVETELSLDYCNFIVNYLYQNVFADPAIRLTCEAPL